jgi:hypothetical protein
MSMSTIIRTYPTREHDMARIKCAHCKQYHTHVWEVRQCATNQGAVKVFNEPAPKPLNIGTSVPEGHYALLLADGWKFYRVSRPTIGKWAGRVFVDLQASDEYFPVRDKDFRNRILAAISDAGVQEAMLAYGQQIGRCGVCNRTLTHPESIRGGIGPVCAGRMGW